MVSLEPKICNLCGGEVKYIPNENHVSGYAYVCTCCGAYIGTHVKRPKEALGLLSNEEMRRWKVRCHSLFDVFWEELPTGKLRYRRRCRMYARLAKEMGLEKEECRFANFTIGQLKNAFGIMLSWKKSDFIELDKEEKDGKIQ